MPSIKAHNKRRQLHNFTGRHFGDAKESPEDDENSLVWMIMPDPRRTSLCAASHHRGREEVRVHAEERIWDGG